MRLVKINGYRSGTTETGKPWETSRVTEEHGPGQSGDVPGSGRSSLSLRLRGSSPLGSTISCLEAHSVRPGLIVSSSLHGRGPVDCGRRRTGWHKKGQTSVAELCNSIALVCWRWRCPGP